MVRKNRGQNMEDEYTEVVREFYAIYRPLQKKYNLRDHMHFDIYKDGLIEIWEYEGETRKKCISIAREEKDIDCYKRAIDDLKYYKKDREKREHETAMAGRGIRDGRESAEKSA